MGRAKSRGQPSLMESSLCCVLAAFQGVTVVVELRNESIVRGTLETADHLMKWVVGLPSPAAALLPSPHLTRPPLRSLQMSKVAFTPFEV